MSDDIWKLVENEAKKDHDRSVNRWIEIHLTAFFLKQKMNENK